jgi:hypothetical protein
VDPVDIGICSYEELLAEVQLARKRKARADARAAKEVAKLGRVAAKAEVMAAAPLEPAGAVNPYQEHLPMERPDPELPIVPETQGSDVVKEEPASPPSEEASSGTGEAPGANAGGENDEDRDKEPRPI